jgi:hypothetical protein
MANPRIALTPGDAVVLPLPAEAHLVHETEDCLVEWRESAAASAGAYRRWSKAPRCEEHRWYSAYVAWLDQEQTAARRYELAAAAMEHWLERTRP